MPYGGSQWYYGMSQIISTLDENMTKIWGKHQLAFGGRYRHERFGYLSDRSPDTIAFSNLATAVYDPTTGANYGAKPNTGYQDARLLPGGRGFLHPAKERALRALPGTGDRLLYSGQLPREPASHHQPRDPLGNASGPSRRTRIISLLSISRTTQSCFPQPTSYYIQNGYTTQAIITNLQNLGAKFETPKQGGHSVRRFRKQQFQFQSALRLCLHASLRANGAP